LETFAKLTFPRTSLKVLFSFLISTLLTLAIDKHRGFGFVDFEDEEDAAAAVENMHGAELFGKVLKCNMAKPMTKLQPGQAVWTAEEWLSNSLKADGGGGPTEE
jgi:RNA recognition motif-containing protein